MYVFSCAQKSPIHTYTYTILNYYIVNIILYHGDLLYVEVVASIFYRVTMLIALYYPAIPVLSRQLFLIQSFETLVRTLKGPIVHPKRRLLTTLPSLVIPLDFWKYCQLNLSMFILLPCLSPRPSSLR